MSRLLIVSYGSESARWKGMARSLERSGWEMESLALLSSGFLSRLTGAWLAPLRKRLAEGGVDAVVTTGVNPKIHRAGASVKDILWLADICGKPVHSRCLKKASAVTVSSPALAAKYPLAVLLQGGYNSFDFDRRFWPRKTTKFVVFCAGLDSEAASPLNLWHEFSDLCRKHKTFRETLQLRIEGKVAPEVVEDIKLHGMDRNLVLMGELEHDRHIRELRSSDLILMPMAYSDDAADEVPSEIYEYMASRRPVLGVGSETGIAAQMLSESGSGKMFDHLRDASAGKMVHECWDAFKTEQSGKGRKVICRQYSYRSMAEVVTKLIGDGGKS